MNYDYCVYDNKSKHRKFFLFQRNFTLDARKEIIVQDEWSFINQSVEVNTHQLEADPS